MGEWYSNLDLWKKILYPIILIGIIITIFFLIPKYTGPEENCTFIDEKANLHEEYYITVLGVNDRNSAFVLKNKDDIDKTELIGTSEHYIEVILLIEHINVNNSKEIHKIEEDDFKLKDHTGVQIKNINLFSKEGGLALENKNFSTTKAIIDYEWYGTQIIPGERKEICIYFKVSKDISIKDTVIILETDFFVGRGSASGTDIVLGTRG